MSPTGLTQRSHTSSNSVLLPRDIVTNVLLEKGCSYKQGTPQLGLLLPNLTLHSFSVFPNKPPTPTSLCYSVTINFHCGSGNLGSPRKLHLDWRKKGASRAPVLTSLLHDCRHNVNRPSLCLPTKMDSLNLESRKTFLNWLLSWVFYYSNREGNSPQGLSGRAQNRGRRQSFWRMWKVGQSLGA